MRRGRERARGSGPEADAAWLTRRQAPEEARGRCRRAGRDRGRRRPRTSSAEAERGGRRRRPQAEPAERAKPRPKPRAAPQARARRSTCPATDGAPAAQEPPATDGEAVAEPVRERGRAGGGGRGGRCRDRRRRHGRRRAGREEAHAPRLARRPQPEAQAGRRQRRRGGRRRGARTQTRRDAEAAATEPMSPRRRRCRSPRLPPQAPEPVDAAAPAEAGYVPMSEWIEDFDRR